MKNIKEIIEIAINVNFTVKRYEVKEVSLDKDFIINVIYFDRLINDFDSCKFSF